MYRTGELLNYLGITRDKLRFYEEKGLLNPKKNKENNYRNYDIYDIYKIMSIDFYKKRGMTISQIQELLKNEDVKYMDNILENKKNELEKLIYDAKCMIKRIEETQTFSNNLKDDLNVFQIKPLPLYKVIGEISEFVAVEEYENVIDVINSNNDDMISQIMRYISFDKDSVISTKMLIVNTIDIEKDNEKILKYPKCLFTVAQEVQTENEQRDLIEEMHRLSTQYAAKHNLKLLGEAFARIRLITYKKNETKTYIEIFIPIK
ncbi:MerR family transcriptional regulator [Vallitalea longa]|nr:MerR family transcriptional regulator [Vallitalea longa]